MEMFFLWLSVVIIFFLIELMAVSFFFFFSFSFGAFIAALLSLYTSSVVYQLLCFVGASFFSFLLLHMVFHPQRINKKTRTNSERLPGMRALVIKSIAPGLSGQVKIEGAVWSARVTGSELAIEGEWVEVVAVQGSHVVVRRITS